MERLRFIFISPSRIGDESLCSACATFLVQIDQQLAQAFRPKRQLDWSGWSIPLESDDLTLPKPKKKPAGAPLLRPASHPRLRGLTTRSVELVVTSARRRTSRRRGERAYRRSSCCRPR